MEFRDLLPRRRMVRHYRPEPVPQETIERIVETVRRAPSAGYSQGQRLLVVTEAGGRTEIARIMGDASWTAPDGGSRGSRAHRFTSSSARARTTTTTGT